MNKKNIAKYIVLLVLVPLVVLLGAVAFDDKKYIFVSACVAVLSCVPFFMSFEGKKTSTKRLVLLAVMLSFSVAGRYIFAFLPHFKPVTAIVVIAGIYLGTESGFLCGALSALVSGFIFGLGPWTPFQMFAWGLIGLLSSLLSEFLKKNKIALCVFGAVSGVLYSLLLDIVSTMWYDGVFNPSRYLALFVTALPVTAVYAASNVIFLFLLATPMGKKLERIKIKYGL
ncbi:MAG: ECF transporter S component [Clostridia bacterium]|nr:ECF transporter S component [Clostridia bacterium]